MRIIGYEAIQEQSNGHNPESVHVAAAIEDAHSQLDRSNPFDNAVAVMSDLTSEVSRYIYMERADMKAAIGSSVVGHLIEEAGYGRGKTQFAKTVAKAIGGSFDRAQGNNEKTAEDYTGSMWFNLETNQYEFRQGPVFANVVLADELQRSPERAQEGLIEAMEEGQVTPNGSNDSYELPAYNFMIATRNLDGLPIERGILDRFAVSLEVPPVDDTNVDKIMATIDSSEDRPIKQVTNPNELLAVKQVIKKEIVLGADEKQLIKEVVKATFADERVDLDNSISGSLRAYQDLGGLARYFALTRRSKSVEDQDIQSAAPYVLGHRVELKHKALKENTARQVISQAVASQVEA
jgi:MoxR-like ATPase